MTLFFILMALAALAGGLGVLMARSPVHSLIALIVNLVSLAALFLTLSAEFLAVIQVIVYAGAVMVLFLFVIGLITARTDPIERPKGALSVHEKPSAVVAALLALVLIAGGALATRSLLSPVGDDFGSVQSVGEALFLVHLLPLQLAALVLLVAAVGVVILMGRRQVRGS